MVPGQLKYRVFLLHHSACRPLQKEAEGRHRLVENFSRYITTRNRNVIAVIFSYYACANEALNSYFKAFFLHGTLEGCYWECDWLSYSRLYSVVSTGSSK